MELSTVINERRSIREYTNKKIDNDLLKDILEHAIKAPSAKNRQPWHFVVLNDQTKKEYIAKTLLEKTDVIAQKTCEVIKECSTLILVFANIENELMDIQSVGACIENMILRSTDLGIGSLWIGFITYIEKELQHIFKCNKKLIAGVALGYTKTKPEERPRKTIEEISVWY